MTLPLLTKRQKGLAALRRLMERWPVAFIEAKTPADRRDVRAAMAAGFVGKVQHYEVLPAGEAVMLSGEAEE